VFEEAHVVEGCSVETLGGGGFVVAGGGVRNIRRSSPRVVVSLCFKRRTSVIFLFRTSMG